MGLKNLNQESKYKIFAIVSFLPILIYYFRIFLYERIYLVYIICIFFVICSTVLEKKKLAVIGYYLLAVWTLYWECLDWGFEYLSRHWYYTIISIGYACFATLLLTKKEKDKLFVLPLCLFCIGTLYISIRYFWLVGIWQCLGLLIEIVAGFFVMKIFCNPNKNMKIDSKSSSKLNNIDALIKLKDLYDQGILTEVEYNAEKAKLLN